MSTQTKTPAQLAEEFLRKYATVIGTLKAIEDGDRPFLLKYATVVGSPAAIDLVAPEDPGAPTGETGSTGTTDAGAGEGTDDQGD